MYATRQDLATRFGELSISELESMHSDGELASNTALDDAANTINSYLSIRYAIPLVKSPVLQIYACNIARYYLHFGEPTQAVDERYKEAIRWLEKVASGKLNLQFNEPLTDAEQVKAYVKPAVPIGKSYTGDVFGDDVFAKMPSVGGQSWR